VFLINHGADVYARNNDSPSVSDLPYDEERHRTSFPGDVWDAVLAEGGYSVLCHRKRHGPRPRVAIYRRGYTREMFERLWEGREHLCPYYYNDDRIIDDDDYDDTSNDGDSEELGQVNGEEQHGHGDEDLLEEEDMDASDSDSDSDGGGACLYHSPDGC